MAGKKPALGRGLDALFGDIGTMVPAKPDAAPARSAPKTARARAENAAETPENAVLYIDIDEIKPNAMQPRQAFAPEAIEELAASIETYGVIQPVLLQKAKRGYELIAGERRWRAARKAGLRVVPAIIRKVSGEENAVIALVENMQRENLNTIEEATAFKTIIGKYGMTQEALAKAVGKSRPHVANTLRTLTMQPEIVEFLKADALSLGHANALGAVKDAGKQLALAKRVVKDGLSVREAERLALAASEKGKAKPEKPAKNEAQGAKAKELRGVEQELTSATGVRVVIGGDGEKGSVELRYHDRQGLEEIIDLLRSASAKKR